MTPNGRGIGLPLAKLLVAAILVATLCLTIDLDEAAAALERARPLSLATAFAASVLGVLVSAEKWRGFLCEAGVRLSLAACTRLYWVGMFASNFLPTSVGGDAVRLLLTPAPGRRAAVAGSILVERLTGFLVMLALCTLGLALRPQYFDEPGLRAAILAAVLALELAVAAALLAPRWLAPFLWRLAVRLPAILGRVAGSASRVAAAVADLARAPAVLGRAMGLSAVFYGTIIVAQHAVLQAVGAEVPLVEVALVAAVVPLATMLPMSLNGLGVAEGIFVLLYAQLGVEPEVALAAAVLRRLVDVANSGLGGLVWLGSRAAGRAGKGLQHVPAEAEDRMSDRAGTRGPATAMVVMLTGVVTWELYHHLSVKPAPLPMLLFELLEVVLLVGCTLTCTLLVLRVRMRAMVAATAGMLAVLLTGELYLGVAPVTPPRLLFELLEVVLLVGASIACALLVRPAAGTDQGRVRNVCI